LKKSKFSKSSPLEERFAESFYISPCGCWLWNRYIAPQGYGEIWINGEKHSSHRASWIIHHGAIPDCAWVLHKCDVRHCVNPAHLFLGTPADNSADMVSKKRQALREKNAASKLTSEQSEEIKKMLALGWKQRDIARKYGVSQSSICHISRGRTWK
jgi:hypothetical protein